jgi:hypothetical protein
MPGRTPAPIRLRSFAIVIATAMVVSPKASFARVGAMDPAALLALAPDRAAAWDRGDAACITVAAVQ